MVLNSKTQIDMALLDVLLSTCLLLSVATAITIIDKTKDCSLMPIANLPYEAIAPRNYELLLLTRNDSFVSIVKILIDIRNATSHISLNALNLEISKSDTLLISTKNNLIYEPRTYRYCAKTQILAILFSNPISPGFYILHMRSMSHINANSGLVKHEYVDEDLAKWILTTSLKPVTTRRLFPCWDEPPLKASFKITVRHPLSHRCLSNMPVDKVEILRYDMMSTTFISNKMPTYLLGIAIIDLVHIFSRDLVTNTVNVWARQQDMANLGFAYGISINIGSYMSNFTKVHQNLPKIDIVVIPNSSVKSHGRYGLIFYGQEHIAYKTQSIQRQIDIALSVAHEMVRQWFGGILSPAKWTDLWLVEALAKFFQYYTVSTNFKDIPIMDLFVTRIQQPALRDKLYTAAPVNYAVGRSDQNYIFCTPPMCYKAAAIIHMLYKFVTKEVFYRGIVEYFNMNWISPVTSNDFWTAMQSSISSNKLELRNANHIKEIMIPWTTKRYYLVNVTRRAVHQLQIEYTESDYSCGKNCSKDYINRRIPITYTTEMDPDFFRIDSVTWLTADIPFHIQSEYSPIRWIILNLQQNGNYRVNYDVSSWQQIADYLNSERYTDIHVLNRAQIVDDAFHFLIEGQLDVSIFWNIVKYLTRERNYIPWCTMENIFSYLSDFFKYAESTTVKLRMTYILDSLLNNVGLDEYSKYDSNNVSSYNYNLISIKLLAIKWACELCYVKCQDAIAPKVTDQPPNIKDNLFLPRSKDWVYCTGLKAIESANASSWIKLTMEYERTQMNDVLKYVTRLSDITLNKHYFMKLLNNEIDLELEYRFEVIRTLIKRHIKEDSILTFILEKFDKLPRDTPFRVEVLNDILSNLYYKNQLDKVEHYVQTKIILSKTSLNFVKTYIKTNKVRLDAAEKKVAMFMDRFKVQNDMLS